MKNKDKPRHLQDRRYRKRMARKRTSIRWVAENIFDDRPGPLTTQQWRDLFLCDWSKTPPGVVVIDIEARGVGAALARSMAMITEEMQWGTFRL